MLSDSVNRVFENELHDEAIDVCEENQEIAGNISKITKVISSSVRNSVHRILNCVDHNCGKNFRIFGDNQTKIDAFSEAFNVAFREVFFCSQCCLFRIQTSIAISSQRIF